MADIEREIKDTKARLCLDCGKCTVVCPVAQCDPDFNPRLITQRRLNRKSSDSQDETIWSCISCYMCVERCNYRVQFPEFISALRWEAREEGFHVKCNHGGSLQALMRMMAREDLHQNRLGWLPDDIEIASKSDTLFFVGCAPYFDVIFTDLDVNTLAGVKGAMRLLNKAKVPFNVLDNERCCGHDLFLQGDKEGFMALAQANVQDFARKGIKKIITNCPECYHTLKVYYLKMLDASGIEVYHLTEIIAPLVQSGELQLGKLENKVTYHDPCRLGRCARLFDEPRMALNAVSGLEILEMDQSRENALCCGSSPWSNCGAVNQQIQTQRLIQAESTGANIMVTACPKCQIHLKCAQKIGGDKIPQVDIQDLASLLAKSFEVG